MELGMDVQECTGQETKQGFKVVSHRFKSGDQNKNKAAKKQGHWDRPEYKGQI